MKKTLRRAVVSASLLLLVIVCGCKEETNKPENQELTKQRQSKVQEHKKE